ncbi:hypothetical protein BGX38DRAFT_1257407 [Terfezia claveryi]|nr:hypothetical protein BGX38DRAFT_1257407 [Terfezia claveryi]
MKRSKKKWNNDDDWELHMSRLENSYREDEEVLNIEIAMQENITLRPTVPDGSVVNALANSIVGAVYKVEQVGRGGPVLTPDHVSRHNLAATPGARVESRYE